MIFETNADVLNWYEKQPRALTNEFISSIPWVDVKKYPLDEKFVPVLLFMRDVETLTEVYHQHLLKTPTGKDKIISRFMERWGVEEITHGEVINRFLNEAGIRTDENWQQSESRKDISLSYKMNIAVTTMLANCIGKKFTGAHMAYGAINEMCTLQSYRRLIDLADHPVLTHILRALMKEESVHTQFYWSVARIELQKSNIARQIARSVIKNFWVPVGQGAKTVIDANNTVVTLFGGNGGLEILDKNVTQRAQALPGFEKVNTVTDRLSKVIQLSQ